MHSQFINEGLFVSLIGVLIVFFALLLIYGVFSIISKILKLRQKNILRKNDKDFTNKSVEDIPSETLAVICSALHLYMNSKHDEESNAMTIKTISRRYSPWSSKIYVMNNLNKPYF